MKKNTKTQKVKQSKYEKHIEELEEIIDRRNTQVFLDQLDKMNPLNYNPKYDHVLD